MSSGFATEKLPALTKIKDVAESWTKIVAIEFNNTTTKGVSMADTALPDDAQLRSAEALLEEPEPWEHWETQLVLGSIGLGLAGLVVLGFLINKFLLP